MRIVSQNDTHARVQLPTGKIVWRSLAEIELPDVPDPAEGAVTPVPDAESRAVGCLLGLATGDALGTTLEFQVPGSFARIKNVVGGGAHKLLAGQWTDDTSMALCLAASLLKNGRRPFDMYNQMQRYLAWVDDGRLSSNGRCFDIGNTTNNALQRFRKNGNPRAGSTSQTAVGNGSLMRLAPIPILFASQEPAVTEHFASESSATTHANPKAMDCCRFFAKLLARALAGETKEELLSPIPESHLHEEVQEIAQGQYKTKEPPTLAEFDNLSHKSTQVQRTVLRSRRRIVSSSCCTQSLEAALWAFYNTNSFKEGALLAANLGGDADTTCAIYGQLAGAHYGAQAIPQKWLEILTMRPLIETYAAELHAMSFHLKVNDNIAELDFEYTPSKRFTAVDAQYLALENSYIEKMKPRLAGPRVFESLEAFDFVAETFLQDGPFLRDFRLRLEEDRNLLSLRLSRAALISGRSESTGPKVSQDYDGKKVVLLHTHDALKWGKVVELLNTTLENGVGDVASLCKLLANTRKCCSGVTYQPQFPALHKGISHLEASGIFSETGFFEATVPWILQQVLWLPSSLPDGLDVLSQDVSKQVFLSRRTCAALACTAFLGLLPEQTNEEIPGYNLAFVLDCEKAKTLCLLSYLQQVSQETLQTLENEFVSFARRALPSPVTSSFWSTMRMPLQPLEVRTEGVIEADAGALQADFANEYLGGGVLHGGNVQEEIRFSVCPECIVGMTFCERMLPHEAIFIVGAQQYSHYSGYGRSFQFDKPCLTRDSLDEHGRARVHIVAFDALCFPGESQYGEAMILRELQKAYVACLGDLAAENPSHPQDCMPQPFATGNWGCGVFGGDPQLKALLQWMAASANERATHYYSFGDERVAALNDVVQTVKAQGLDIGHLFGAILSCEKKNVFPSLLNRLANPDEVQGLTEANS